ncbi:cupin domain-containing protein [Actinomycetospora termitidis]|uniref:Cupin domain-containing protein n=1 Tax=Actinomycetospora termitidis TaxID=3053470 RepID=A0ABT7M9C8_9PSEU|nr:cupin domain-containing protein [Actinomycetospora sp. Odt1-22]MDL5157279.1 cupin domain-containing protein [Actinomycetospora sp. Odt1-22]
MSWFVRAPGAGDTYDFDGATFTVKATGEDTEGRVSVMEQAAPVGLVVAPHTHEGEDEMFHVLAGRVGGRCGDDEFTADTGGFIFLPRDVEHSLWVLGDEPVRMLTICGPARFDRLVRDQGTRR